MEHFIDWWNNYTEKIDKEELLFESQQNKDEIIEIYNDNFQLVEISNIYESLAELLSYKGYIYYKHQKKEIIDRICLVYNLDLENFLYNFVEYNKIYKYEKQKKNVYKSKLENTKIKYKPKKRIK